MGCGKPVVFACMYVVRVVCECWIAKRNKRQKMGSMWRPWGGVLLKFWENRDQVFPVIIEKTTPTAGVMLIFFQ